jgi:glycosyltransferase involved in cell wall biosynthesis
MINIAALTDHTFTPSSRYRVRQFINPLKRYDISVKDFKRKYSSQLITPKAGKRIRSSSLLLGRAVNQEFLNLFNTFNRVVKSNSFDAIWLSRQLIIGSPPLVELVIKKPLIYDIDDAVFLTSFFAKKQVEYISRRSNIIFAANDYLANYLSQYSDSIHVIPTTVDTDLFRPVIKEPSKDSQEIVTIGWSGTSSSYKYFYSIEDMLVKLLKKYKNVELIFVSDRPPYELEKLSKFIKFVKWSAKNDVSSIQTFDIGIMPIANDEWSKGKSSYKMLLYASCGIPVVVDLIGENRKILEEAEIGMGPVGSDEWYDAIEYLILNDSDRKRLGNIGRDYVVRTKSIKTYAPIISNLIIKNV